MRHDTYDTVFNYPLDHPLQLRGWYYRRKDGTVRGPFLSREAARNAKRLADALQTLREQPLPSPDNDNSSV